MSRIVLFFAVIFISPSLTYSAQPMKVLQHSIDKGIHILNNPEYKDAGGKELQQKKLREIIQEIFDFEEFSKLSLGRNWRKFNHNQRKEFVHVFSKFLLVTYLPMVQEKYRDEKVIYLRQHLQTKSRALVKTKVLWRNLLIPVDVRMNRHNTTWKVYDVIVLGVSAAKNYRSQFNIIFVKESPIGVIELLKKRINQLEIARNT